MPVRRARLIRARHQARIAAPVLGAGEAVNLGEDREPNTSLITLRLDGCLACVLHEAPKFCQLALLPLYCLVLPLQFVQQHRNQLLIPHRRLYLTGSG